MRGSGSGSAGYALLANTGTLSPVIWNSANTASTKQRFRITVDHSDRVHAYVTVDRDAGGGYIRVIPKFDAKTAAGQAAVPTNWLVSFTGSTGTNTNFHEISQLRICAPLVTDPDGAFACLEAGTNSPWSKTARKPLYTKLVDTDFKLDIAAMKTDGTLQSKYSKSALVELFDDTTPQDICADYASPVASKIIDFNSAVEGRILTDNFNIKSTYKKLRCRVKECKKNDCLQFTNVPPACSSDQFSVRPTAATLATSATAGAPSATSTPTIKAGANFALQASTRTSTSTSTSTSYSGTLTLDTTKLTAQITSQDISKEKGGVVGTLTPPSLTANATDVNATYSEVGYLYLAPGAFRDDSFTSVDQPAECAATDSCDCITSTASDNNLADAVSGGKYGCSIGNKTAVSFGRFIPDHFDTTVVQTGIAPAIVPMTCPSTSLICPSNASGATGVVYSGQPFTVQVTSKDLSGTTTTNYQNKFAKVGTLSAVESRGGTAISTTAPGGTLSASSVGVADFSKGVNTLTLANPVFTFAGLPTVPTDVYIRAIDTDLVSTLRTTSIEGGAKVVSGRIKIPNIYGSELLALPMTANVQYYNGTFWVTSTTDNLTSFDSRLSTAGGNLVATIVSGLGGAVVVSSPSALPVVNGVRTFTLSKPSARGSADMSLNAPSYLPTIAGRATFGVYKSPLIYRRENY